MKQKTKAIAALLIVLSMFTSSALAAVGPQASHYLASYGTWMTAMGDGEVALSFDVWAVGTVASVGATYFTIQEKQSDGTWKSVKTCYSSSTDDMVASDTYIHGTTFYYQGVAGRQYQGSIIAYSEGYDGGSDSRSAFASAITAK